MRRELWGPKRGGPARHTLHGVLSAVAQSVISDALCILWIAMLAQVKCGHERARERQRERERERERGREEEGREGGREGGKVWHCCSFILILGSWTPHFFVGGL